MLREILEEMNEGFLDGISMGPRMDSQPGKITKAILKAISCSKAKKWIKQAEKVLEPKYGLFKIEGKLQGKQKLKGLWWARFDHIVGSTITIYPEGENSAGTSMDLCNDGNTEFYTPVPYSTKKEKMPNRLLKGIK